MLWWHNVNITNIADIAHYTGSTLFCLNSYLLLVQIQYISYYLSVKSGGAERIPCL